MKTRGQRNIDWIQRFCRVPEGRHVGDAIELRSWQKRELKNIYDNPAGTRRAIISFARKNGKTSLAACMLLLHLCGPEHRRNSQLFSAAQSREQAAILFGLAAKMVRLCPELNAWVHIRDANKQLFCRELGTLYRALSAEASTSYGLSPVFIVHDELGQVRGPRSELYEALETATGAQEDPLSVVISTQAPTNSDFLSILIDDALAGNDPRVIVSLYTTPIEEDPFCKKSISKANPALGQFLNIKEVMAMASDAKRMPSREAEFRNLVLNQRVEASSPFVSRNKWQACMGEVAEEFIGVDVYCGLDLSEINDLTAFVMISKIDNKWQIKPIFWLPEEGLLDRAKSDRVPYDLWKRDGYLQTTPGKSIEYEYVAGYLYEIFGRYDIKSVAFDRWNFRHLKPWLSKVGFDEYDITEKFVEFGQGFQSMSPALRELEGLILNEKIVHDGNPVLAMCAGNAVVQSDPAGNRKLTKMKSHGRIDGMIALAMAVSVAVTKEDDEPEYKMMFL